MNRYNLKSDLEAAKFGSSAAATALLLLIATGITFYVPFLLYYFVLPEQFRSWLTEGNSVGQTIAIAMMVSALIALLAYLSYVIWHAIARQIFGRSEIDALMRSWSGRD
jgi:hypothetical protein